MTDEVSARVVRKMADVPREAWDALAGERPSPFLRWDWLALLEETGCAVESSGWLPHHVLLHRGKRLVGGCPLYLKLHSMGEFVFDHDWALYAERLGLNYYPKLLVGVPFTPVTGPRFLTAPDEPRAALVEAIGRVIADIATQNNISSAHVTFCRDDEAAALEGAGYLRRIDVQYHWQNRGYADFEGFLGEVRGGRRNKIRRERKEIERQGIAIRPLEGDDLTDAALDTLYDLYAGHVDGMYWGRRYLTRALFRELGRRM
ncbi:MAG: peptidogalycan biosysnthesis protein, partial [Deltaproteobacteria bacterium]|nr:peptidogalycan biosysnthesis protein [Deltaproteobacteria bacterium]